MRDTSMQGDGRGPMQLLQIMDLLGTPPENNFRTIPPVPHMQNPTDEPEARDEPMDEAPPHDKDRLLSLSKVSPVVYWSE